MRRYILSSEAEQDIRDIRAYYEQEAGVRVARNVLKEITRGFEILTGQPGIGHFRRDLTADPVKFWQVFSYLIIYEPEIRPIGIVRVLHSSQDIATILNK